MQSLLLATLLFMQAEERNIPRISKDVYQQAVRDLAKANDLIAEDAGAAVERVTSILTNPKIKYFEVKLLIEVQPSIKEPYDFFPYQIRGRARMKVAERAALEPAINSLKLAVEDLKTSADKKVPGSAEMLKAAEEALAKKVKEKTDLEREKNNPFTKFKVKFDDLLNNDKYKSALALVGSSEGQALTEEERQQVTADCEQKCADFRDSKLAKFKSALNAATAQELKDDGESGFNRTFTNQVPSESELTEKAAADPALQWARRHLKTIKAVVAGQGKIEDLLAAAAEAIKLDPPDAENENPCFKGTAFLASELCQKAITANTTKAESAPKAERAKLQAAADGVFAQWKAFIDGQDPKVIKRHSDLETCTERLAEFVKAFPVELAQVATFDIDRCFLSDPGPELKKVEDGLQNLIDNLSTMGKVAIESRQELYSKFITAGALRRFIEGMTEDQVISELRDYKTGLIRAGGPTKPEQYGPKVKRVFDRLKS
jgi:hypothetical protein